MDDSLLLAGEGSSTLDFCRLETEDSSLGGWRSEIEIEDSTSLGGWGLINENSSLAGKPEMADSSSVCNKRAGEESDSSGSIRCSSS